MKNKNLISKYATRCFGDIDFNIYTYLNDNKYTYKLYAEYGNKKVLLWKGNESITFKEKMNKIDSFLLQQEQVITRKVKTDYYIQDKWESENNFVVEYEIKMYCEPDYTEVDYDEDDGHKFGIDYYTATANYKVKYWDSWTEEYKTEIKWEFEITDVTSIEDADQEFIDIMEDYYGNVRK